MTNKVVYIIFISKFNHISLSSYLQYKQSTKYLAMTHTSDCELVAPAEVLSLAFCGKVRMICSTVGIFIAVANDEAR